MGEFILGQYNYWVVIILMMMGLYIVFSRGNLVKKIVGLNVFQTSVFIFYITLSKVAGGTAPILIKSKKDKGHHGEEAHADKAHDAGHGTDAAPETGDPSKIENIDAAAFKDAMDGAGASEIDGDLQGDTALDLDAVRALDDKTANEMGDAFKQAFEKAKPHEAGHGEAVAHGADAAGHGADAAYGAGEILYSNPLPHVLILTAIVVGVATTAVGLSLAVRIREAYGTIEEDELQAADDEVEFGRPSAEGAG